MDPLSQSPLLTLQTLSIAVINTSSVQCWPSAQIVQPTTQCVIYNIL